MLLVLNYMWYSQAHLNFLNFLKGTPINTYSMDPLIVQIDTYYGGGRRFRRRITSGELFNPYVLIAFLFFVVFHTVTLPFYVCTYVLYLFIYMWSVFTYAWDPKVLELQAPGTFRRFPNQWVELIYNTIYRRPVITAFTTVYIFLRFIKSPDRRSFTVYGALTFLLRLTLLLLIRLLWICSFHVSWYILSRSYRFAMAFVTVRGYQYFRFSYIRTRVINNYQCDDLLPGLSLRIYKGEGSIWNFNPKLNKHVYNANVLRLTTNPIFRDCFMNTLEETDVFVYNNHVTSGCVVGTVGSREVIMITNNTSGIRREWPFSMMSYESLLPKKNPLQSCTIPHFVCTDSLSIHTPNYPLDDFRTVVVDKKMLNLLLVGRLLARGQVMLNCLTHPLGAHNFIGDPGLSGMRLIIDPKLLRNLNTIKHLYETDLAISSSWSDFDLLSYHIQILHHHSPGVFKDVYDFKLNKQLFDYDAFIADLYKV